MEGLSIALDNDRYSGLKVKDDQGQLLLYNSILYIINLIYYLRLPSSVEAENVQAIG